MKMPRPLRKRTRPTNLWEEMPWKNIDTSQENLGDFQDAVFFSLEELDPNEYKLTKQSQGYRVDRIDQTSIIDLDNSIVSTEINQKKTGKTPTNPKPKVEQQANDAVHSKEIQISPTKYEFSDIKWGMKEAVVVHTLLRDSLTSLNFVQPTPIQYKAIPLILRGATDLIGCAETGSGKTLAFGLPILHRLLWGWKNSIGRDCPFSLVLAPTRELALQISAVLKSVIDFKPLREVFKVEIVTIVGGLSEHKQRRQLCSDKKPVHILVATPGRLCELLSDFMEIPALQNLSRLKFLVVDEVDRMIEDGHFPELQKIFQMIREHEKIAAAGKTPLEVHRDRLRGVDETLGAGEDAMEGIGEEAEGESESGDSLLNDVNTSFVPTVCPVPDLSSQATSETYDALDHENSDGEVDESDRGEQWSAGEGGVHRTDIRDELHDKSSGHLPKRRERIKGNEESADSSVVYRPQRQTLLFSATALRDSHNDKGSKGGKSVKKRKMRHGSAADGTSGRGSLSALPSALRELVAAVAIQKRIEIADVTVASTAQGNTLPKVASEAKSSISPSASASLQLPLELEQFELVIPAEDKDLMAYYLLTKHPGRTLVFVNSIKAARRLDGLLRALGLTCRALHAQQQQKQRIKALEAFREAPRSILVATDVAARGLDIPSVQTVLHYDVPRSPQLYVHRSGRTARAGKTGKTVLLVTPEDKPHHEVICASLAVRALSTFPIELAHLGVLKERVNLAKKIFTESFVESQKSKQSSWLQQTATEMELDLDDQLLQEEQKTERDIQRKKQLERERGRLKALLEEGLPDASYDQRYGNLRRKKAFVVVAR